VKIKKSRSKSGLLMGKPAEWGEDRAASKGAGEKGRMDGEEGCEIVF